MLASPARVTSIASALGGERIPIRAVRTAHDLPPAFPSTPRGRLPGLVVGHRTFDREKTERVTGDDQAAGCGRTGVGHGGILPQRERSSLADGTGIGCGVPLVNGHREHPGILWREDSFNDHYQSRTGAL